jgi:acetoacetyl-CoA synthetase
LTAIARFTEYASKRHHLNLDALDYPGLHRWSVTELGQFWSSLCEFFGVRFHDQPADAIGREEMPGAEWFPGATLNYAEHALSVGPGRGAHDTAVIAVREDGVERFVTHRELREQVARARAGLRRVGVGVGDRVVALAPNTVETLVAFLATASLGAIWSSCSPDTGLRAVVDRFSQIEPVVLLTVNGYRYGGKRFEIGANVAQLQRRLPSLRTTVVVPDGESPAVPGTVGWAELVTREEPLSFVPVPFDHPLWVLYSSGTTGLPKAIVHGHGGIVLDHLKALGLHLDLGPADTFFWFTTTGWMMWNYVIAGLLVGSAVVLYDGNPAYPDLDAQWRIVERHKVTYFGLSPAMVTTSLKAGLRPRDRFDLASLKAVGATGSPLSADGFRWIADAVGDHLPICSMSGGTDLCAAFLGWSPTVPVWLGEMSCAWLGTAAEAYDSSGSPVVDEVGELVLTRPMPSMPVCFWNDPDGSRFRKAYFEDFPGVWRHGDSVRQTARGSFIIGGRSDSTLNRGGVRMGTAEFYAVVESFDEVSDSLVVDTGALDNPDQGRLLCFVVLTAGVTLDRVEPDLRAALRTHLSPRHVPDQFIAVEAVPRTQTGKKCEVPVKRILAGADPDAVISRDALANPDALDAFVALASTIVPPT